MGLGGGGGARSMNAKAVNLAEMRRAADGVLDQPEFYSVVCRLALVQTQKQGESQPLYYMACQEPKEGNGFPCNRRVDSSGFCAACNRAGKAAPRLFVRCKFADSSDSAWLTTFHEAGQRVLGMTAEEVQGLENASGGREALEEAISKTYFDQPLQLTLRAKLETYNGEPRTNVSCIDAKPVSRGEHGRFLLKEISEMFEKPAMAGA